MFLKSSRQECLWQYCCKSLKLEKIQTSIHRRKDMKVYSGSDEDKTTAVCSGLEKSLTMLSDRRRAQKNTH